MRYYTKEYYSLMMSLGTVDMYEPVIDKDYTDEEIEDLYQKALDRYVEEERASYDEPPELFYHEGMDGDDLEMYKSELEEYENREPFDAEEAEKDFKELYEDNLEEPDEDLPDWVKESVDPRILAMFCMPEPIYKKLLAEDEANEERFDALDEEAEDALEEIRGTLPEEYEELMDVLEELEDSYVVGAVTGGDEIELSLEGWDEEGEEATYLLRFEDVDVLEDDGIEVHCGKDEDGDTESDCELLYSEVYMDDDMAEIHMLFDNNGLKYLTFRCSDACVYCTHEE